MRMRGWVWAGLALSFAWPSVAAASPQSAPKIGDSLRLLVGEERLVVTLVEAGPSGLSVRHGREDSVQSVAWSGIREIEAKVPRSRLKGAGVGATYGLFAGFVVFFGTVIAVEATPAEGEMGGLGQGIALAAVGAGSLCLIPLGGLIGFIVPGSDWVAVPVGAIIPGDGRPPGLELGLRLAF